MKKSLSLFLGFFLLFVYGCNPTVSNNSSNKPNVRNGSNMVVGEFKVTARDAAVLKSATIVLSDGLSMSYVRLQADGGSAYEIGSASINIPANSTVPIKVIATVPGQADGDKFFSIKDFKFDVAGKSATVSTALTFAFLYENIQAPVITNDGYIPSVETGVEGVVGRFTLDTKEAVILKTIVISDNFIFPQSDYKIRVKGSSQTYKVNNMNISIPAGKMEFELLSTFGDMYKSGINSAWIDSTYFEGLWTHSRINFSFDLKPAAAAWRWSPLSEIHENSLLPIRVKMDDFGNAYLLCSKYDSQLHIMKYERSTNKWEKDVIVGKYFSPETDANLFIDKKGFIHVGWSNIEYHRATAYLYKKFSEDLELMSDETIYQYQPDEGKAEYSCPTFCVSPSGNMVALISKSGFYQEDSYISIKLADSVTWSPLYPVNLAARYSYTMGNVYISDNGYVDYIYNGNIPEGSILSAIRFNSSGQTVKTTTLSRSRIYNYTVKHDTLSGRASVSWNEYANGIYTPKFSSMTPDGEWSAPLAIPGTESRESRCYGNNITEGMLSFLIRQDDKLKYITYISAANKWSEKIMPWKTKYDNWLLDMSETNNAENNFVFGDTYFFFANGVSISTPYVTNNSRLQAISKNNEAISIDDYGFFSRFSIQTN